MFSQHFNFPSYRIPGQVRAVVISLIGVAFVVLSPASAAAQCATFPTAPGCPKPPKTTSQPAPHRFVDRPNILLTGLEITTLLADGITTQNALQRFPNGREANPLARPFVEAGWPGQAVAGGLFLTGELSLRYALHRTHHHRLERWLPILVSAVETVAAVHNARLP